MLGPSFAFLYLIPSVPSYCAAKRGPAAQLFPPSLLSALPHPLATHRGGVNCGRRVVAVAHEITDNRIASNEKRTAGRVILEERITIYLGFLHKDTQPIGVTDVEIAADIHEHHNYRACRPGDGHVPVYGCWYAWKACNVDVPHAVPLEIAVDGKNSSHSVY